MVKKARTLSPAEILGQVTETLREYSVNPSITAYKPLPHQKRFHDSTAKGKLFIGGNRSGKTVGGGTEAVKWLTGTHERGDIPPPPIRGRVVAVDIEEGINKITLPEIKKWLPKKYLINGNWEDSYSKVSRTLTLTNGSTLEFMSYEQQVEKFAGTSRHFVWFDEEPPQDIFNECSLRLVDTEGSWWITMTPLIEMSWTFDALFEPWTQGDKTIEVFEVNTSENTHINSEALAFALHGIDEAEKEARTHGTYISHTGLVYKGHYKPWAYEEGGNLLEDIIESDNWPIYHLRWGHFVMLDHGYNNPTAILFGAFDKEGRIVIYDEIYQSGKLVEENAEDLKNRLRHLKIMPNYMIADPTIKNTDAITGTSIQIEYAKRGIHLALGFHDIIPGIARVQSRFESRNLLISRRCEKLIWELNRYRWDKFTSSKIAQRRNAKEVPVKRDDHALDALRYGVCSSPALPGEVDLPVGNVLNLPEAGLKDYDYSLVPGHDENTGVYYDSQLGTEW